MAEPGLELEQGHRLLCVVQLGSDGGTRPVAGDASARIFSRDAGLLAQRWDERLVHVAWRYSASTKTEKHRYRLGRLGIDEERLRWPLRLPQGNGLADQRVHRLGVAGAGLVRRHVQQARGVVA